MFIMPHKDSIIIIPTIMTVVVLKQSHCPYMFILIASVFKLTIMNIVITVTLPYRLYIPDYCNVLPLISLISQDGSVVFSNGEKNKINFRNVNKITALPLIKSINHISVARFLVHPHWNQIRKHLMRPIWSYIYEERWDDRNSLPRASYRLLLNV